MHTPETADAMSAGLLPPSVRNLAHTLARQLSRYDQQLVEIDHACGRYSAQLRFLELEPDIERSRQGLQHLRERAIELGPATFNALNAIAAAPDPARWRPTPEDLQRRF